MNTNRITFKYILSSSLLFIVLALFALCFLFTSCKNQGPEGVAATVNGVEIKEDDITADISGFRRGNNLERDDNWQAYLKNNKKDANAIRDEYMEKYIDAEVYVQLAKQYNILPTQEELNASFSADKSQYASEEEYQNFIKSSYDNYEKYKKMKNADIAKIKVDKLLVDKAETKTSDINKFFLQYNKNFNGGRGYYQLQFKSNEKVLAQQYLDQINTGKISFEDATKKRTLEDKDKINFDYVIYDFLIKNPDTLNNAIKQLQIGQTSGLIETDNYIYIVKLVDVINCSEDILSMNDLPEQSRNNLCAYVKICYSQDVVNEEFVKEKEKFDIKKFDAPDGLPYY